MSEPDATPGEAEIRARLERLISCLLYTSDAADE